MEVVKAAKKKFQIHFDCTEQILHHYCCGKYVERFQYINELLFTFQ